MNYKNQISGGAVSAVLMWGMFILADAIDEYVLDASSALGMIVLLCAPIALFVKYIIDCKNNNPDIKRLVIWHSSYTLVFLIVGVNIGIAISNEKYFIEQITRSTFLDLNGIEYILFGVTALVVFWGLCFKLHIIDIIVKRVRMKRAENSGRRINQSINV